MRYSIRPAGAADVPVLMSLRTEAEDWLQAQGSDQWSDRQTGQAAISKWHAAIEEGRTWLIRDDARDVTVGTVSRGPADRDFWKDSDQPESGLYLYKLIISRSAAGLGIGSLVIDWAARLAALEGRAWVRLDCWRTATGLQQYYERLGFEHVRTESPAHRKSGWLGQRSSNLILHEDALRPLGLVTLPAQG
ncbi:GNAT family N-acetyltransferase [Streptomyces sp. NPDC057411]|uniref:GNAT family N-acetyltransferase n=1 Tax=unclassified Streptomyces TaxID=2593676 RepID=UPI00363A7A4E